MQEKWDKGHIKRGYKGFDAIFCDLEIFKYKSDFEEYKRYKKENRLYEKNPEKINIEFGFEVLATLSDQDWPSPIIVLSSYADLELSLMKRREFYNEELHPIGYPIFGDFLSKDDSLGDTKEHHLISKLQSHLIPLSIYEKHLNDTVFASTHMFRILHQLVQITLWPILSIGKVKLPQIVLLGPTGSGKSHLAQIYLDILKFNDYLRSKGVENNRPSTVESVNCGFLTSNDQGGRITLFGSRDALTTLPVQPGIFETATVYDRQKDKNGFAPTNANPVHEKCGVVFLDEVTNLPADLQTAVLTTFEEGTIRRVTPSNEIIPIGCHIIIATNADPTKAFKDPSNIDGTKPSTLQLRNDLIDRCSFVINVPGIDHYRKDELAKVIKRIAEKRRQLLDETNPQAVSITISAMELIDVAMKKKLITSFRHLQSIANLRLGENVITEGNLRWVIEKGLALKRPIVAKEEDIENTELSEKASILGLPEWLCRNDLPRNTAIAVEIWYSAYMNQKKPEFNVGNDASNKKDIKSRAYLMTPFLKATVKRNTIDKPSSMHTETSNARKFFGLVGNKNDDAVRQVLLEIDKKN